MGKHLGVRMFPFQFENLFEREFLMHMTRSVPQHDVVAAGHPLQVIPKIAVRGEQYLLSLQRPDDFHGVGRGTTDICQCLHLNRGIDIGHHLMVGIPFADPAEIRSAARIGQGTPGSRVGYQHLFPRRQHLGRLSHEIDARKKDDVRIGRRCGLGKCEGIPDEIRHLLHFGPRIVMSENHGVLLSFQRRYLIRQSRVVSHLFIFLFIP